jgi:hypothetical protein
MKCRKNHNPEWEIDLYRTGIMGYGCPNTDKFDSVSMDDPYPPKSCPKLFEHLVSAGLKSVNIDKRGGDA